MAKQAVFALSPSLAIDREDIMRAQTQWRTFLRESPGYPLEAFAGRGIAILAGGLTYMVPAWVNIHMLRRTGEPPFISFFLSSLPCTCALSVVSCLHQLCNQLLLAGLLCNLLR